MVHWLHMRGQQLLLAKVKNADWQDWYISFAHEQIWVICNLCHVTLFLLLRRARILNFLYIKWAHHIWSVSHLIC